MLPASKKSSRVQSMPFGIEDNATDRYNPQTVRSIEFKE